MVSHFPVQVVDTDEAHARLNWMRAEFRAAQQRRYEKGAIALANRAMTAKPASSVVVEPPT